MNVCLHDTTLFLYQRHLQSSSSSVISGRPRLVHVRRLQCVSNAISYSQSLTTSQTVETVDFSKLILLTANTISLATMTDVEEFSLSVSQISASGERGASDIEQRSVDAEHTDSRQMEPKRTKLCVLIGSGMLQLPIWGTFNSMS